MKLIFTILAIVLLFSSINTQSAFPFSYENYLNQVQNQNSGFSYQEYLNYVNSQPKSMKFSYQDFLNSFNSNSGFSYDEYLAYVQGQQSKGSSLSSDPSTGSNVFSYQDFLQYFNSHRQFSYQEYLNYVASQSLNLAQPYSYQDYLNEFNSNNGFSYDNYLIYVHDQQSKGSNLQISSSSEAYAFSYENFLQYFNSNRKFSYDEYLNYVNSQASIQPQSFSYQDFLNQFNQKKIFSYDEYLKYINAQNEGGSKGNALSNSNGFSYEAFLSSFNQNNVQIAPTNSRSPFSYDDYLAQTQILHGGAIELNDQSSISASYAIVTKHQISSELGIVGAFFGQDAISSQSGQNIYVNGNQVESLDAISQVPITQSQFGSQGQSFSNVSSLSIQAQNWVYKVQYYHISVIKNTDSELSLLMW